MAAGKICIIGYTLGPAQLEILNAELLIRDKRILAIFRCKRVNLANGVIFGVEGAFEISDNLI